MIDIKNAINKVENSFGESVKGIGETHDEYICLITDDFVTINKITGEMGHIGSAKYLDLIMKKEATKLEKPDLAIKRREEAS